MMKLLSEIGWDLSRFANVKHFHSWLGLCPGTKISGGKALSADTKRSANRTHRALKMAAMNPRRRICRAGPREHYDELQRRRTIALSSGAPKPSISKSPLWSRWPERPGFRFVSQEDKSWKN